MARMSIDDMFLRDPRITRLARVLGVSKFDARGRLLEVIGVVYDRVDDLLTELDIDTAAEIDGFAKRMVEVDLAVPSRGKFRVRGASERINYLRSREESGRAGGIKSGESRRNRLKVDTKVTFEGSEAPANPIPIPSVPDPASASPPIAADPVVRSEEDSDRLSSSGHLLEIFKAKVDAATGDIGKRRARGPKPSEPTQQERDVALFILARLGQRNGVAYSGAKDHVKLIVDRLREGIPEGDLRKVIGYCAMELEWQDDPRQGKYLRPETLFGKETIHRYLDAARTWFEKQGHVLEPRLEVVS